MRVAIQHDLTVKGLKLAYHRMGSGRPLILLHGGGPGATALNNFDRNLETLSQSFDVIALDLPGYGGSAALEPMETGLLERLAGLVLGLADELGLSKFFILGNSLGGGTALMLAKLAPERVEKLVAFGPNGGFSTMFEYPTAGFKHAVKYYEDGPSVERMRSFFELMVFDHASITDQLVEARYLDSIEPAQLAKQPALITGSKRPRPIEQLWRQDLSVIQAECLLIYGQYDRVTPLDTGLAYLKLLPRVEMHIFADCGHWAQWEKPIAFNGLVTEFLNRAPAEEGFEDA